MHSNGNSRPSNLESLYLVDSTHGQRRSTGRGYDAKQQCGCGTQQAINFRYQEPRYPTIQLAAATMRTVPAARCSDRATGRDLMTRSDRRHVQRRISCWWHLPLRNIIGRLWSQPYRVFQAEEHGTGTQRCPRLECNLAPSGFRAPTLLTLKERSFMTLRIVTMVS
eukprot:SAG31_NODE_3186_length_4575_cov_2.905496_1_plen_166_part_00